MLRMKDEPLMENERMTGKLDGRIGHRMRRALEFAEQWPTWHTFDTARTTRSAVERLQKRGLVETNQFGQFRIVDPNLTEIPGE